MKNIKYLINCILAIMACISVVSCSDEEDVLLSLDNKYLQAPTISVTDISKNEATVYVEFPAPVDINYTVPEIKITKYGWFFYGTIECINHDVECKRFTYEVSGLSSYTDYKIVFYYNIDGYLIEEPSVEAEFRTLHY